MLWFHVKLEKLKFQFFKFDKKKSFIVQPSENKPQVYDNKI